MIEGLTVKKIQIPNMVVEKQKFLCFNFDVKKTRNGTSKYLTFNIQDTTGIMTAKKWNWDDSWEIPVNNKIYCLSGSVKEFNGILDFQVISDFILTSDNPEDYIIKYINKEEFKQYTIHTKRFISNIEDTDLKKFTTVIFKDIGLFSDNNHELFTSPIATATAAVRNHHVGWGGLLMHSYNVAIKAYHMSGGFRAVNRDLCIVGALLHDIGKIFSYECYNGAYRYTEEGLLLDHIILGLQHLEHYKDLLPYGKMLLLNHIIASHHDKMEWGSVKTPMTLEAKIVAQADYNDFIEECLIKNMEDKNFSKDFIAFDSNTKYYTFENIERIFNKGIEEFKRNIKPDLEQINIKNPISSKETV